MNHPTTSVLIQDLVPTATHTMEVSFSAHWQGERDHVCAHICLRVVWPPWDRKVYSKWFTQTQCNMFFARWVSNWQVCVHIKAGAWEFRAVGEHSGLVAQIAGPLGMRWWERSIRRSSTIFFSASGLLLPCQRYSLVSQPLNKSQVNT